MQQYLQSLIERMSRMENSPVSSDQSVAWQAHREAELLRDPVLIDELADFLAIEPIKEHRKSAYFILGRLGKHVRNADCVSILLTALNKEQDKYILCSVLEYLSWLNFPADTPLTRILSFLHDDRWLVRHSAIQALQGAGSSQCENHILALLETTTDQYDMTYCHATLGRIGTAKAIPYIENNAKSRKRDVRMSAQSAIENIRKRLEQKNLVATGEYIQ